MSRRISLRRLSLGCAIALSLSASAGAQEGEDHAAHHGAGMPAGGGMSAPAEPGSSDMAKMMNPMMDRMINGEGENEHGHESRRTGFISQLLAFPALDEAARQRVAAQAGERVSTGLAMINAASADGARATTVSARLDAARRLREGTDLFRSGTAAQGAIGGLQPPREVGLAWLRDQLDIDQAAPGHADHWFGISPSHLLLMLFLGLVSATLIALQIFRLRRIGAIAGGVATAKVPAKPEPKAAPPATRVAPAPAPVADSAGLAPSNAAAPAGASLRKPKSWAGQLRVVQIVRETPSVLTFRLADPTADRLPFDFLPGQFLQVEVEPEAGKTARRSYTIASSPTQRAYVELTVKREEQGVVSRYLHDKVVADDLLKVSGPFGAFTFTGTDAQSIVLIAGGVGITPMMSVLRYLTDTAWKGDIFFFYGARSTEEFVFRDELERLERRFPNLHVVAAMQRAPGTVWMGPEGPITREMILAAVPEIASRRIHMCGPPAMMGAMRGVLAELGVPEAQLHTEAFGPASLPADHEDLEVKPAPAPADKPAPSAEVAPSTVTFSVSGVSAALPADETVLEAAEGAGVEISYACRAGTCGACVVKLLQGEVTMEVESGLAPADKAQGYVLACQAKGTGTPLVVEA
ncbi:2Fe-2S iron-sulfur cluster-binding protein [Sphingomonas sp. S-NIH.Pt1_0416]|uniref:2Fe-2S iron-sulfur cluster-binding protein n=2 Tax=unclassified Sphingomonas TaxID=196159 RepID=UPI0004455B26|nr:2Fe-2S iron-sulfur cluster-binding protein [Sphingomonas sp. S-NIH.Pt1_0416]EZP67905.1 Flavodoxin [Sphingomonas paucimobilis]RSU62346.1 flavodoxin [Sphingomonas sp. S-NIH.Pt1_0416]